MSVISPATPLLIEGARVIDPAARRDEIADLFLDETGRLLPMPPALPPVARHTAMPTRFQLSQDRSALGMASSAASRSTRSTASWSATLGSGLLNQVTNSASPVRSLLNQFLQRVR